MIIGTAGHIDHGKSTLVKALTGTDTDRLPEEKQRGMSIELGYAFMPAGAAPADADGSQTQASIGFIDVPGHEKLVHTMIAGATGIDFGLLLVAADDGVMPQTREHLAVLSLLGVQRGAVALTKIDRVDAARVSAVRAGIEALLSGTSLAGVPILPVSAVSGEGVEALRDLLCREALGLPSGMAPAATETVAAAASPDGSTVPDRGFRLAIDRVFSLDGTGTVVTGTVHAGRVKVGDLLDQAPGSLRGLRVRSLHAQNRKVDEARAGQRCAIGLAGVSRDALKRGDWLVQPGLSVATDRFDVQLQLWSAETRPLKSGARVHLHLGTTMSEASVAVLDRDALAPGQTGLVQLLLPQPVAAWHGERLILRDASGQRVLAGGQVLDVRAPVRYRRTPQRLRTLAALQQPAWPSRLAGLLASLGGGLNLEDWRQRFGLAEIRAFEQPLKGSAYHRLSPWLIMGEAAWQGVRERVQATLADFHQQWPDELGPDAGRLRRLTRSRLDEATWRAVLDALLKAGEVGMTGAFVHLPGQGIELAARDEALMQKIMPALEEAGAQGAWIRDLAERIGESPASMRAAMARLSRSGRVHQIVKDLYQDTATTTALGYLFRSLIDNERQAGATRPSVTVARFRDASGLGRKRAVQVLEFFDRIGLCRRVGDEHLLRPESRLFRDG
ncbi:MAG: selenocysteine-specific translation elongation factor [Lautropia sp.]|nr:selenocysteine-specific translation elongation factor [Lautropia sp.]